MQTSRSARAVILALTMEGRYTIPAEYGPVPGRHRPEIYRVAKQFLTVPSMGDAGRFPQGDNLLVVDVSPSGPNQFDFEWRAAKPWGCPPAAKGVGHSPVGRRIRGWLAGRANLGHHGWGKEDQCDESVVSRKPSAIRRSRVG
jgi:hypothetical protein